MGRSAFMALLEYMGILASFMLVLYLVGKLVQFGHNRVGHPYRGVNNGKKNTSEKRVALN
jgi:hypothetical protein